MVVVSEHESSVLLCSGRADHGILGWTHGTAYGFLCGVDTYEENGFCLVSIALPCHMMLMAQLQQKRNDKKVPAFKAKN